MVSGQTRISSSLGSTVGCGSVIGVSAFSAGGRLVDLSGAAPARAATSIREPPASRPGACQIAALRAAPASPRAERADHGERDHQAAGPAWRLDRLPSPPTGLARFEIGPQRRDEQAARSASAYAPCAMSAAKGAKSGSTSGDSRRPVAATSSRLKRQQAGQRELVAAVVGLGERDDAAGAADAA